MATPSIKEIKQIPCKLVWNPSAPYLAPTDLTTLDDAGGTVLGDSDDVYFLLIEVWVKFYSAIYGRNYSSMRKEEMAFIGCLQRDFDLDMLTRVRPEVATNTTYSGKPLASGALETAGETSDDRGGTLLILPKEPEHHQAVIFYNAVGTVEESARVLFETDKDWGYPVLFEAMPPDDGSEPWKKGYIRDFDPTIF